MFSKVNKFLNGLVYPGGVLDHLSLFDKPIAGLAVNPRIVRELRYVAGRLSDTTREYQRREEAGAGCLLESLAIPPLQERISLLYAAAEILEDRQKGGEMSDKEREKVQISLNHISDLRQYLGRRPGARNATNKEAE